LCTECFRVVLAMKPIVTIALPVYNGGALLKLAVHSILQQSFSDWELIILDDASTDNSLEVMRSFDDARIRLVEGEINMGLSARLNMAIDMARGDYFARMDHDDIIYPQRLEKQLAYLQSHPKIDLLATATTVFRGAGEALGYLPVQNTHDKICARPWNGFHMPHPTWMGRTEWFRQHHYDSSSDGAEDQNLLLCAYNHSQFACLETPLLAYREGDRPLKKMLRARRIFTRAFMKYYIAERSYLILIRVVALFLMKSVADILHATFRIRCMRNRLLSLSEGELAVFARLCRKCNSFDE